MDSLFKPNINSNTANQLPFCNQTNANTFSMNYQPQEFKCFPPPTLNHQAMKLNEDNINMQINPTSDQIFNPINASNPNPISNLPTTSQNIISPLEHSTAFKPMPNTISNESNIKVENDIPVMKPKPRELSPKEIFENEINEEYGLMPLI